MRRIIRLAAMLASVLVVGLALASPASAHSSSTIHSTTCTGYKQVGYYVDGLGHRYESLRNLCVATYSVDPFHEYSNDEAVIHEKCYVDGSVYDGCRWAGYVNFQDSSCASGCTWNNRVQTSWCAPCDSTWLTDSGQKFSGHWSRLTQWFGRGKGFSVDVRFKLLGGGDHLDAESDTWSGVWG